jgi:uncharacterized protein (DUF486 family)
MTWPAFAPLLFLSISNVFMTLPGTASSDFPTGRCWIVVLASWASPLPNIASRCRRPHRSHRLFGGAIEDNAGDHHADRVWHILGDLFNKEAIRWNHMAAFCCLVLAGYFAFAKW